MQFKVEIDKTTESILISGDKGITVIHINELDQVGSILRKMFNTSSVSELIKKNKLDFGEENH